MTPFDPLAPTNELISLALTHLPSEEDEDSYWETVRALHGRGTREVFAASAQLLTSACPHERALGADVHGQLGYEQDKPFSEESALLLSRLLEAEEDEDVIQSALFALSHLFEPSGIPAIARFTTHPSEQIRYAATHALGGLDDERAVALLIERTTDPSDRVRDWATFALGSQTDRDSPELRAALWARTTDSDNVTRGEALKGLAARKAAGAVAAIVAELEGPAPHDTAVEAAQILADSRLVPSLERLRAAWTGCEDIGAVIETCRGASGPTPSE